MADQVTGGVMAQDRGRDHGRGRSLVLVVGALGVVFGDIGTSPLYALRETFHVHGGHSL